MKNKLSDLNDHLFAQLERLSDESIKGDELKEECSRSKAVTTVANQIVANGRLAFDIECGVGESVNKPKLPKFLQSN